VIRKGEIMTYLAFEGDELKLVTSDFTAAKGALVSKNNEELIDCLTFTTRKNHILIEIEGEFQEKLRIADVCKEFELKDLEFGCEGWGE
jgi:hypothetical protein